MNNFYGFPPMERVNRQIEELQAIKNQMMNQQPVIQQNFVSQNPQFDFDGKWIENKNEINNIQVTRDSIFMDKNNPIFYIKSPNGEIKGYDFTEHVELDEKDIKINELQNKIKELERRMEDGKSVIQSKSKSKQPVVDDNEI